MNRYITPENRLRMEAKNISSPSVFLAGGISNCPNWQTTAALRLLGETNFTVVNPRWEDYDSQDEYLSAYQKEQNAISQISWEFEYLSNVNCILFWFPSETLCPIALFELGKCLGRGQSPHLYVGHHPDYQRALDIKTQCSLEDPDLQIYDDLDELIDVFVKERT